MEMWGRQAILSDSVPGPSCRGVDQISGRLGTGSEELWAQQPIPADSVTGPSCRGVDQLSQPVRTLV